jgi:hypothetical protein
MVWPALREAVSTSPAVTLVTLYSLRWMVPILFLCPKTKQRSGFHVTNSYKRNTIQSEMDDYQSKHYAGRKAAVNRI